MDLHKVTASSIKYLEVSIKYPEVSINFDKKGKKILALNYKT
jgi:hypothetical protein